MHKIKLCISKCYIKLKGNLMGSSACEKYGISKVVRILFRVHEFKNNIHSQIIIAEHNMAS